MADYYTENPKHIFLSRKLLKWNNESNGSNIHNNNAVARAYQIWHHSSEILKEAKGEFDLVDAITNLKRAIEQRTKLINNIYKLKTIPNFHKKDTSWDIMSKLNIIRPVMSKSLYDIRNNVEHHDLPPPSANRCKELLDFTWYFLRSTDNICLSSLTEFSINNPSSYEAKEYGYKIWLAINIEISKNWEITFNGWIDQSNFSIDYPTGDNILPVVVTKLSTRDEAIKDFQSSDAKNRHEERSVTEHWLIGSIPSTSEFHRQIITCYFNPLLSF